MHGCGKVGLQWKPGLIQQWAQMGLSQGSL